MSLINLSAKPLACYAANGLRALAASCNLLLPRERRLVRDCLLTTGCKRSREVVALTNRKRLQGLNMFKKLATSESGRK